MSGRENIDTHPGSRFRQRIAENDALIRSPELNNGASIAAARTAIYTDEVREWATAEQERFGYKKPFAVVALGGTGRGEMAPCSDNDFALLFEEPLEHNAFLLELQRQILHSGEFDRRHGFHCAALPFSLDDVPDLAGKQLNSFLDLHPVHDPMGLADAFRERIRATFDPFEFFLHVRGFWKDRWEKAAGEFERLDRFDIKNDGLRVFQAAIWTLAGPRFIHSHDIYRTLEDPRDLDAYHLLLRLRSFIHLRNHRPGRISRGGLHPEDVFGFEEFNAFGEMLPPSAGEEERYDFANVVRAGLLSARRRVACFAKAVIGRELSRGWRIHPTSPIVYGASGLIHSPAERGSSNRESSRAALSLLLASQHYGIPIDPAELHSTFRNAGDWLEPVPELSALFYERRGSLADSFDFLSQVDGAEDRLFPGYGRFETSLDARIMSERRSMRSALERNKIRALDRFVTEGRSLLDKAVPQRAPGDPTQHVSIAVEAALLDADHLAAVKLALKTKRLPVTDEDRAARRDASRPLHDRHSSGFSGIALKDYYRPYERAAAFSAETLQIARFLIAHRRGFKERATVGINDARQVGEFVNLCGTENLLRALFVFTCADRSDWESAATDPARWFNTRELYVKALMVFRRVAVPESAIQSSGYSPDHWTILQDFGADFFGGLYRHHANRFGAHLVRLAEEPDTTGPKASILRDGGSMIVGVAARDFRGLAAAISGAFWRERVDLQQAHLFSATRYGLALDFFHVAARHDSLPATLPRAIELAIQERRYIAESDEAFLPVIKGQTTLHEWRPGLFCLRFETGHDTGGLIYALTYKLFRHLGANIFGLTGHASRGQAYVSIYLSLPPDVPFDDARKIISERF